MIYLSTGLAVILAFIGVKLILEAVHENQLPFAGHREPLEGIPTIPTWLSLTIILGVLVIATVASLLKTRGQLPAERNEVAAPDAEEESAGVTGPEPTTTVDERSRT